MLGFRNKVLSITQQRHDSDVTTPSFSELAEDFSLRVQAQHEIRCEYEEGCLLALDWALAQHPAESEIDTEVLALGSFLGQMIIKRLGGNWTKENDTWIIDLNGTKVYPFQKARKRLLNGRKESLTYFYQVLKRTFREQQQTIPQTPNMSVLVGYLPKERASNKS